MYCKQFMIFADSWRLKAPRLEAMFKYWYKRDRATGKELMGICSRLAVSSSDASAMVALEFLGRSEKKMRPWLNAD